MHQRGCLLALVTSLKVYFTILVFAQYSLVMSLIKFANKATFKRIKLITEMSQAAIRQAYCGLGSTSLMAISKNTHVFNT